MSPSLNGDAESKQVPALIRYIMYSFRIQRRYEKRAKTRIFSHIYDSPVHKQVKRLKRELVGDHIPSWVGSV